MKESFAIMSRRGRWRAAGAMAFILSILLLGFLGSIAFAQGGGIADHVVISEVQVADEEFIELYNPTNEDIDMTGWHCCYFPSAREWNDPWRDKTFPEGATIQAHGFYLIATTSGGFPGADWNFGSATRFLDNFAGSIGVFPWDPNEKAAEEAKNGRIDAVGYGSVDHVKEDFGADVPPEGKSIERKARSSSTAASMGPAGEDEHRGNGYDSDDNSQDFVLRAVSERQNSSSLAEYPWRIYLPLVIRSTVGSSCRVRSEGLSSVWGEARFRCYPVPHAW